MNSLLLFPLTLISLALIIVPLGMDDYSAFNNVHAQVVKTPTVKITSPVAGQQINILSNNIIFSGISSDNSTSNCQVSVILNNIKPYQPTRPVGNNDYSSWNLDQSPYYVKMKEGQNKLTAKISCLASPANLTKWSSVNFTGIVGPDASTNNQSGQLEQETSEGLNGSKINQTVSTNPSAEQEMRQLAVKVQADKNPVYLGDKQRFTLIVSDAASHLPISNAEVNGLVTHPSGESKGFTVTTDANGQGFYTLKIGKTAELGKTTILFQVTSSGYKPIEVKSSSDVKDNTPANPFDEQVSFFNLPFQPKDIFS